MRVCGQPFNLYLALALAATLLAGCRTQSKEEKQTAALRLHMQVPATSGMTKDVTVMRSSPVSVTVSDTPFLTEANVLAARVTDTPGGFSVVIKFDEVGGWTLEQYTAGNPGRHFAIFGQWGEKLAEGRWLAAPLITHRLGDGELTFTPDASRDEVDQFVQGLNNVGKENRKHLPK